MCGVLCAVRPALVVVAAAALLVGLAPTARAGAAAGGFPLPTPIPSLPPLPSPPPVATPPVAVTLPVSLPAPPPAGSWYGGQALAGQPPPGSGSAAPAAQSQGGYAPPAEERTALPDEPQRFDLEYQQQQLAEDGAMLDDDETEYEALAIGGGRAGFAWPVPGRRRPHVTQRFGCTTVAGEPYSPACATRRFHTGVDLGVPSGTPVLASKPGVARTFHSATGYGNYVLLVHGGGWYTLYAHLSRILVSDGEVVGSRQVIGDSGSTGFSTGPHLHFEVRHAGDYLDPCAYLGC